jgi:Mn2+/Fe2+ NRAMP family transporter
MKPGRHSLTLLLALAGASAPAAEEPSLHEQAAVALRRGAEFFRSRVAVEGTYLWQHSEDLSRREGEGKASPTQGWVQPPGTPAVGLAFLLALVGWMPSPIDVAVWSSLWTLAKDKASGVRTSVRHARRDFLIGYLGTAVLAFAFVLLGATVLFQSGAALSEQGAAFSMQLVDMYSQTLGSWSRPFVLVAALTTMFSTTLALVDGFPRAIERTLVNLRSAPPPSAPQSSRLSWGTMAALGAIALLVVVGFAGSLTAMVDFATIVSFLTAPVLGYLNLKAVTSSDVPAEHRPGPALLTLSWVGLVLLGGTGVAYLVSLLCRRLDDRPGGVPLSLSRQVDGR